MSAVADVSENYDPLPHLLALHNRNATLLPPWEPQRMRDSVLASSFERNWKLIEAVHRSHIHQEVKPSPSSDPHLILVTGNPFLARLGFNDALQENLLATDGAILLPGGAATQWQSHDRAAAPHAEFLHFYLKPDCFARVAEELGVAPNHLALREILGATDATLTMLARCLLEEIHRETAGSRLYADSLACALAVHLLRNYRGGATLPASIRQELTAKSRQELTPHRLKLSLDISQALAQETTRKPQETTRR